MIVETYLSTIIFYFALLKFLVVSLSISFSERYLNKILEKDIKIEEYEGRIVISFLNFSKEEEDIMTKIALDFFRSRASDTFSQSLSCEVTFLANLLS